MRDFIFSNKQVKRGKLADSLANIYSQPVETKELHGKWGSLALVNNLYHGFQTIETKDHIVFVIGGPVLTFRDNQFLVAPDGSQAVESIYHYWIKQKKINWSEDLSGPFLAVCVDKKTGELRVVTSLMGAIHLFFFQDQGHLLAGTHVDVVAKISRQSQNLDLVTIAEFIQKTRITPPFTTYKKIKKTAPATRYTFSDNNIKANAYWLPTEDNPFSSIEEAASHLREAHQDFIDKLPLQKQKAAILLSGGQDSRAVLASIPKNCEKTGIIFLDQMNREGKIARKAAEIYEADFKLAIRSKTRYLDILPQAAKMVGSTENYLASNSQVLSRKLNLNGYPFVFDGSFADNLFKCYRVEKYKPILLPFIPELKKTEQSVLLESSSFLKDEVVQAINQRRQKRLNFLKQIRPNSAEEWFYFWPAGYTWLPHLITNRRLFRAYFPFLANKVVKVAAAVPQKWKLQRRLFTRAYRPLYKRSWYLPHSYGWFPYFPWYINLFIKYPVVKYLRLLETLGIDKHQHPWFDWNNIENTSQYFQSSNQYRSGYEKIKSIFKTRDHQELLRNHLKKRQKFNMLQTCYLQMQIND